jgi:CubicO group peptidase (beta-lactamase class C family)
MATVEGECDPRFDRVKRAFGENFEQRGEVGAAVAVTVGGRPVVDLWAGHADGARTRPWQSIGRNSGLRAKLICP